jgi:hypothetical protein
MRKILLSLFAILLLQVSKAQTAHSVDSLRKFSYFIFGNDIGYLNKNIPDKTLSRFIHGTCFFARIEGSTFLISAKHVLTPFNTLDSTYSSWYPDTLYIKVKSAITFNDTLWPVATDYKDTVHGSYFYNDPDVFVLKMKDEKRYFFYSVENYFKVNLADSEIQKSAYLFGFPFIKSPSFEDMMGLSSSICKLSAYTKIGSVISLGDGHYDAHHYWFSMDPDCTFREGDSGSPIFFKETNEKYWLFGGLVSAYNPQSKLVSITRPDEVLKKLILSLDK